MSEIRRDKNKYFIGEEPPEHGDSPAPDWVSRRVSGQTGGLDYWHGTVWDDDNPPLPHRRKTGDT